MNESTFYDELQDALNLAYKINYLVLDNFRHIDPMNHQGVFSREDLFGPKTKAQKTYETLYHDYAKYRNECFAKLQNFFDSYNFPSRFLSETSALVDIYNKATKQNYKVEDVFTSKEVKDVKFLEQIGYDIEFNPNLSFKDRTSCYLALSQFAYFYEQYKMWISSKEIFDALQDDITSHGSKSLLFSKPSNKSIFLLDKETYNNFIAPILDFAVKKEQMLENKRKSLIKQINHGHNELEDELSDTMAMMVTIKLIYMYDEAISNRFSSATKMPEPKSKLMALLSNFISKVILKESDFIVDKVYIHKQEMFDFAQALSVFPELEEQYNKLMNNALGSSRNLCSTPTQKQNA